MKLIVAGSRSINLAGFTIGDLIDHVLNAHGTDVITEIISGGANGIDKSGELYSTCHLDKEPTVFKADWEVYKKRAGHIRNAKMAAYGDCLLLIWDGKSKGSAHMKKTMKSLNKPIYEVIIKKNVV